MPIFPSVTDRNPKEAIYAMKFTPQDLQQHILYEDPSILVIHKPAGLAVQSKSVMQQDLESLVRTYVKGGYVGIVHRLDQPVEGIVLFGKDKASTSHLARQTSTHQMTKHYLAVAAPKPDAPPLQTGTSQVLTDYLVKQDKANVSMVVPEGTPGAKKSQLSFEVLSLLPPKEDLPSLALLKVTLGTGRHHQIRVQLSHAGYPLLGDTRYGGPAYPAFGLCAISLTFTHPQTRKTLEYQITPEGKAFALFPAL